MSICCRLSSAQGVVLNGDPRSRYWGNINLSFAFVEGESLLMGLKVCRRAVWPSPSDVAPCLSSELTLLSP